MVDFQLQSKRFRFKRTYQIFVFHPLTITDRTKLIEEWKRLDERRRKRELPIYSYHKELAETKKYLRELLDSSLVGDIGEAKQWYWIMKSHPFDFKKYEWRANELRLRNMERRLAFEVLEWVLCAERLGYLNLMNGKYFQDERERIEKLKRIQIKKYSRPRQNELTKVDSLICTQIRLYFEDRNGLIFQLEELKQLNEATPKDWKSLLVKQINHFTRDINKKFITNVPKKETKKKMFEITLLQETTKAAFQSIQAYQKLLKTAKQLVVVDCAVVDNRLSFNIGHIKEQFKAPITALSRIEWTRFSPDDIEDMAKRAEIIVASQLDSEKLFQHPTIMDFVRIIYDEKIPSNFTEEELLETYKNTKLLQLRLKKVPKEMPSQLFRIRLTTVWTVVQQRIRQLLQNLTVKIRKAFTEDLLKLQEEFRRYDRALLFRSINPALMLSNKAVVNQFLAEDIGPSIKKLVALYDRIFMITQQVSLDPNQQDLLVSLASFRIALPAQIREHHYFFQKRIASFQAFVTKKQVSVLANAQKVAERLKISQMMTNPQEAESYKMEIVSLIPPLTELITEIDDLNKFEEVVGVPRTEVPRMRQIATDVHIMEELFTETKAYYDHMNEFFDSRRTVVNIPKSRLVLEQYLAKLAQFESQLSGQRAARHFIVNARNDVDVFKKNFAVAEVLSCKRFLDQHWTKMSEIVGFDLSIHANSTMAIICELGLDDVLAQLKPIAYAAEREALIADQLDTAIQHWTKAHIETHSTSYWNLELPRNLRELISQAEKHKMLLLSSKDAENAYSQQEYFLFRRCAKYWQRFERLLRQDSTALRLLEIRHAPCWLIHIEEHMKIVVKGVHSHLNVIRLVNPRLCLTSDHDLLQLFAAASTRHILSLLLREGFPQLQRLDFNRRGQLEIVDYFGDCLVIETVTAEKTENMNMQELIKVIEKGFLDKIIELLSTELNDRVKNIPKMVTALGEALDNKIPGDTLTIVRLENQFFLQHKVIQAQSKISLDFIQLDEIRRIPQSICSNWAHNNFILLVGEMKNTRFCCQAIAQKLFTSIRYVNCHQKLQISIFETLVQVSQKESILVVLENIDELTSVGYNKLNEAITKFTRNAPFPRLFLTAPISSVLRNLSSSISVENAPKKSAQDGTRHELAEELVPYAIMPPTPSSSSSDIKTLAHVQTKTALDQLREDLSNRMISAVSGPMAKTSLKEVIGELAEQFNWLYLDTLTDEQIISPGSGFGSQVSGQLLKILTDNDEEFITSNSLSSYRSSSTPTTQLKKVVIFYGNDRIWEILPFISPLFRKFDDNLLPPPYLTLFDGSTFLPEPTIHCLLCIPDDLSSGIRSSLITKFDIPVKQMGEDTKKRFAEYFKQWKGKIQTAVDKTVILEYVENLVCIMVNKCNFLGTQCLGPVNKSKQKDLYLNNFIEFDYTGKGFLKDLKSQELSDLRGNAIEVVIQGVVVLAANFLRIYISEEIVDQNITQNWSSSFGKTFSALPTDVSNWKLSIEDPSVLVRWEDEPFHVSSMEKDSRIEDLMVVWPAFDRLLYFGKRILSLGNNLLVTGPPFTQKTTLVKMLQKQLSSAIFQWIPSQARVGLENCQQEFAKILEQNIIGDQLRFLVIDKFSFAEPLFPIIELFVDQQTYYSDGEMKKSAVKLKFILICEEEDWINISKTHVFYETFSHLPMRSVTFQEARMLVERMLQWNLTTKSFSSEYIKLIEPMANTIVTMANKNYVYFSPLPVCMRLVKGMFFAFPDNAPDTLSFVRLWLHETLRVIGDAIDTDFEEQFIEDLKNILKEEFSYTEKEIFQIGETEYTEEVKRDIRHLLYSELDNTESFDGLNYLPVKNIDHFNRTVENIIFEHHRNHSRDRIQLSINDFTSTNMQCILRVLRQAGEHICLAGPAGIGRQQMTKLAGAACSATILHHYPDPSGFEAFRKGWTDIFNRAALIISGSNQPVLLLAHMDYCYERVEPRWMEYVRLWLENPEFDSIGDEQLISLGEQIIENEKSLVSHMQSQGIRLPGQRMVRFLPIEVLKEPDVLRHVLVSRVYDLLHVVFMVQSHLKTDFSWCTNPSNEQIRSMTRKILAHLKVSDTETILREIFEEIANYLNKIRSIVWTEKIVVDWNILFHMCNEFQRMYSTGKKNLHRRSNRLNEALGCVSKIQDLEAYGKSVEPGILNNRISSNEIEFAALNKDFHDVNEKLDDLMQKIKRKEFMIEKIKGGIKILEEEIEGKLKKPKEDFQVSSSSLLEFGPAQFKQLSLIARPGLGCRFVAEVLRHLLTPNFKPKRNTMDTWRESQKFLRTPGLLHRIFGIKPMLLDFPIINTLRKYVEHREFKEAKIEGDSELAAKLCNWTYALIQLAVSSSLLKQKQDELKKLQQEGAETDAQIIAWKKETELLQEDTLKIEKAMRDLEISLTNDRKLKDYQNRAGPILEALGPFHRRWRTQREDTQLQVNRLFANCVLQSVFKTMLIEEDLATKMTCVQMVAETLIKYGHQSSMFTVPELMNGLIRSLFSSHQFTLLIDENHAILPILEIFYPNSTTIDMSKFEWTDHSISGGFVRHIYSGTTTMYYNIKKCPPVEYYEILCKWEEKDIRFFERLLELPDDCRLIFVADHMVEMEPQLRRIMNIVVVNEQLDVVEPIVAEHTNNLFELLSDSSAAEILESHEITRRVIIEAENAFRIGKMTT